MAKVKCPNPECQTVSPIPDAILGRPVRCKKCNTRFTAEALPAEAAAPGDSGVMTVVARRVGALRSGVFLKETMVAGETAAVPAAPPRRTAPRLLAALAVALPILLAGGFVAIKALGGRDAGGGASAGPAASGEIYGGIEIGSSGVNATVVELFPDPELGYDYRTLWQKSLDTGLVQGVDKNGVFNPAALKDTIQAVQTFSHKMTEDFGLPPDKLFIVAGSGPFKGVRDRKDLKDAEKDVLLAASQSSVRDGVKQATGQKVDFMRPEKEGELQFNGLVPQKNAMTGVLIDVGSGASRGGYRDADAGLFIPFEGPGLKRFAAKVRAQAGKDPFADVAARLAEKELREPLREAVARKAGLVNLKHVYLAGGIVWVLATFQRPAERDKTNVPLSVEDVEKFAERVRAHPGGLPPFPPLDGVAPKLRAKLEKDQARIQSRFNHEQLVAGVELLRALVAEMQLQNPGRELYFTTYGQISWLLAYIAERRVARK